MPAKTDIELVKSICNIPVASGRYDALLDSLTVTAENMISARYHIPLQRTTVLEKVYGVRSNGVFNLKTVPVRSITQIVGSYAPGTLDTSVPVALLSTTLVAPNQYQVLDADTGLIRLTTGGFLTPSGLETALLVDDFEYDRLEVTYEAGFDSFPQEVQVAVAWLVNQMMQMRGRNANLRELSAGDERGQVVDTGLWPTIVYELLAHYQPPDVGVV